MRRGVMLVGVAILAALVLAAPAGAITYGTPDGDRHLEAWTDTPDWEAIDRHAKQLRRQY
jgi:hypothetical protein